MRLWIPAIIGAAALVSMLVWTALDARPRPTVQTVSHAAPSAATPDADLNRALWSLEAQNVALRDRLETLEARLGDSLSAVNEPAPVDSASEIRDREALPVVPSEAEQRELLEERIATLEDIFLEGAVDMQSGLELDAALRDALGSADLEASALARSECGASLCRAEFEFSDAYARDEGMLGVPHAVPWASDGYVSVDPEDPNRVLVYLTREGGTLPALP